MTRKMVKSEAEWRAWLRPEEYYVCRQKGTEPAFTGRYWKTTTSGTYACICCGQALFASTAKFHSASGWPSFYAPIAEDHVHTETDTGHGMVRTEVLCSKCDAHLGHVFDDGPAPTGQRYCLNSLALRLEPESKA